ncbi:SusC/RagA family TonB-linked outer membrane protein [Flavitalea flava]
MKKTKKEKGIRGALVALLFTFLFVCPAMAQQTTSLAQHPVKGIIKDKEGKPVAAATISVKGKKVATSSAEDGSFLISAVPGDLLVVSSVGFEKYEIKVNTKSSVLDIRLTTKSDALNDVVVVGYGTVKRKDLTGSVGVVRVEDAKKTATYDVAKMLQGQVAGVEVQSSGEPGSFVQIKIRGASSFTNNNPLFVIDGVITTAPFDFATSDIETIQILKDASAAAIYGSSALGGVVIITTKKGRSGPLKVSYNGYMGTQTIPKHIAVTDRVGYQKITSAAEVNAGLTIAPGNDPSNPAFISKVNTDWQKESLRTGIVSDNNLNLSGGNESAAYSVNLGYFDQTSVYRGPQSYKRYSINANLTGKKGIFSYGAKIAYTQSHKVNPNNGVQYHAVFGGNVTGVLTAIPTMPVYDSNRLRGYGGSDNVTQRAITLNVVGMNNIVTDYSDRNRMLGNFWGELELVKNLKYRVNVSYDRFDFKNFHFEPTYDLGFYYLNTNSYMWQQTGSGYTSRIENLLTYNLQTGKHRVDLLGGYAYENNYDENIAASAVGLPEPYYYTFNSVADPTAKGVGSYTGTNTKVSWFGRINYNFDDRYLLTANYRNDASSTFSPAFRRGNYPSVAAAWNIHNERVFHLPVLISTLKLRGGYGVIGREGNRYAYDSYVNTAASYVFGNTLAPGTTTIAIVDNLIKWETKTTTNVAIDMGLFNNALSFTAEYYRNKSTDLLNNINTTLYVGSVPASIYTNAASVQNNGLEFTAAYHGSSGKVKYDINANVSTVNNKVLKLGGTNNPVYGSGSKTEVGRSIGEIYGWQTEGLFQTAADVTSHATQVGAAPGDIKFRDISGRGADGKLTGKPDGKITDDDRIYLGNSIPKLYYGFNFNASYANFDLSVFLQGSAGNKIFNGVYRDLMIEQYSNHSVDALNYWTPSHTNTNIPRPVIYDPNGNGRVSNRFIEDGSYVKLQNAQIGYTIPSSVLARTKAFTSVRFYLSGQNLITFTRYKGYDPDFNAVNNADPARDGLFSRGYDYGSFPNTRSLMVGLQVGF